MSGARNVCGDGREMKSIVEIVIRNQKSEKARVLEFLDAFAARHGISQRHVHELDLAIEEHLTNVLTYAYQEGDDRQITLRFALKDRLLRIELVDDGRPFNPLDHPEPDLTLPLDQRPIGGLGIHMMRKSVDAMEYLRSNDCNILTLLKQV
jgi:anti-sigma regulatory factor (Ser/Thr protein kinase)